MSATIVSYARFQEIRQRRQPDVRPSVTEAVPPPDGELPASEPPAVVCEAPAPETALPQEVTAP